MLPTPPTTTICFNGWETSATPACPTNSAGVKEFPWQMHWILASDSELYLYKKPLTVLPSGPSPVAETNGSRRRDSEGLRAVGEEGLLTEAVHSSDLVLDAL